VIGLAGAELIAARTIDVGVAADAWLARTPALTTPVTQALGVLEFGVWPLVNKLRPFTALDGDALGPCARRPCVCAPRSQGAIFQDCARCPCSRSTPRPQTAR
jgi:hypothetical protein